MKAYEKNAIAKALDKCETSPLACRINKNYIIASVGNPDDGGVWVTIDTVGGKLFVFFDGKNKVALTGDLLARAMKIMASGELQAISA